jgi:hypothetical protein
LEKIGDRGTGEVLNFRKIELPEGYVIKEVKGSTSANAQTLAATPFAKCTTIKKLYWPNTITKIQARTYDTCSSLEVCDYPEGTKITSIGDRAFASCSKLTCFRISDDLASVGTSSFTTCSKLVFEGPMLPKAINSLSSTSFGSIGSTPLQDGKLEIGGSGNAFTWNVSNNQYNDYFKGFNITNLIFGVGVPHAGIKSGRSAIHNPYAASPSSITNIVVKNQGVFAFGTIFNQDAPTTVRNYDVAGWVTGTLVKRTAALAVTVPEARQETAKSYQTRIMAAKNIYWKEFKKARAADNSKYYTPWSELSPDVQQAYWDNFNDGNVGSGDAVPFGLTKGITSYSLTLEGEEPLDPLTIPDNVWIVFKEGSWPGAGLKIIIR